MGFNDYRRVFIFTLSDTGDVFIQDRDENVKSLKLPTGGI